MYPFFRMFLGMRAARRMSRLPITGTACFDAYLLAVGS